MRANSDFQQEAHPESKILKAKTPASPEVTGGACVIQTPAEAEFQEAGPQEGSLAGASSNPGLSVHQLHLPGGKRRGAHPAWDFPRPAGDPGHPQLESDLKIPFSAKPTAIRNPALSV